MKKYYLSLLMAIMAIAVSAQEPWDGTSASWTNGDGSSEKPYLIENGQHLAFLAEQVLAGATYAGKFFLLTKDLDMGADKGLKFDPIGMYDDYIDTSNPNQGEDQGIIEASKCFSGVFDGNGKKIDNIHIYYIDEMSVGGTGLFGCIGKGAIIQNLGIGEKSTIEGMDQTGALVGYMKGGLVQYCYNEGTIDMKSGMISGGLVGGGENGKIANCYNRGMVTGTTYAAGIIGFADKDFIVENCYNNGMIYSTGFTPAGVIGYLCSGRISNCYNAGLFVIDDTPMGVVGDIDAGVIIENCYFLEADGVENEHAGVTSKTNDEMLSVDFLNVLNGTQSPAPWVADVNTVNEGLPILAWQISGTTGMQATQQELDCELFVENQAVYVTFESSESGEVIVMDMTGRTIIDKTIQSGDSVIILDKGIYIVMVKADGQQHITKIAIK